MWVRDTDGDLVNLDYCKQILVAPQDQGDGSSIVAIGNEDRAPTEYLLFEGANDEAFVRMSELDAMLCKEA